MKGQKLNNDSSYPAVKGCMKLPIDSCIKRLTVPAIGHRRGADHMGHTLEMSKEEPVLHSTVLDGPAEVEIYFDNAPTSGCKYSTRDSSFTSLARFDVKTSVPVGYSSNTELLKHSKKFKSEVYNCSPNWSFSYKRLQGINRPAREYYIAINNNREHTSAEPTFVASVNTRCVDRGFKCQSNESVSPFLGLPKTFKQSQNAKTGFETNVNSVDIRYTKSCADRQSRQINQNSTDLSKPLNHFNRTQLHCDSHLFAWLCDKPALTATDNIYRTHAHAQSSTIQQTPSLNDVPAVTCTLQEAPQLELIDIDRCVHCTQSNKDSSSINHTCLNPYAKQRRHVTAARPPVQFPASLAKEQGNKAHTADPDKLSQIFAHREHLSHNAPMSRNLCAISCCADDASFKSAFSDLSAAGEKTMNDACLSDRLDLENVTLEVIVDSLRQMEEQTNHEQANKWRSDVTVNAEYKTQSEYSVYENDTVIFFIFFHLLHASITCVQG